MKKIIKLIVLAVFVLLTVFAWQRFWPRSYPVQHLQERAGTKYWDLPTGSKIGYTFIEGKGNRYPYPLIYLHGGPGAGITNREIEVYEKIAEKGFDIYLYDQVG